MVAKSYRKICVIIVAGLLSLYALSSIAGHTVSFASPDDQEVESAINHLLSSSKEERRDAVKYLAGVETDRASEGLISALDNSDREVRDTAVHALAERVTMRGIGNRAVEGLIHGLDNSSESVRRTATNGLARAETNRATEGLIHALDSSDKAVQRTAVEALAKRARSGRSSDRAVEGLIHALDNEEFEIRKTAATGLRDADSDRARDGLKKALNDSDDRIRQIARQALHQ
jgi:HEAT repeat protein